MRPLRVIKPKESHDLTPSPAPPTVRNNQLDEGRGRGGNTNSDRKGCASPPTGTTRPPRVLARGDKVDPKTLPVNKGQLITSQPGDKDSPIFLQLTKLTAQPPAQTRKDWDEIPS